MTVLVVGGLVAFVQGALVFLTKRSIDALDRSIAGLGEKVEALNGGHTNLLVQVTELKGEVSLLKATKVDK